MGSTEGLIFNIQRFSTEDGPGIRTTVFMKGCPLNCLWCHNVEGINTKPEIVWHDTKCIGCLSCLDACPNRAITHESQRIVTDRRKCRACGKCAEACPAKARELIGKRMTVDAVFNEISKDKIFYETSLGGVTASGGEPTVQPDFVRKLFASCRSTGINTALNTCGYANWKTLNEILGYTDLVLYDLKLMTKEKHRLYTGVEPELIWENAQKIAKTGKPMWVRTPVIPGYTDSVNNIRSIADLCTKLGNVERLDLLPYNPLGEPKYRKLGLKYRLHGLQPPERDTMERLRQVARECGVKTVT